MDVGCWVWWEGRERWMCVCIVGGDCVEVREQVQVTNPRKRLIMAEVIRSHVDGWRQ